MVLLHTLLGLWTRRVMARERNHMLFPLVMLCDPSVYLAEVRHQESYESLRTLFSMIVTQCFVPHIVASVSTTWLMISWSWMSDVICS